MLSFQSLETAIIDGLLLGGMFSLAGAGLASVFRGLKFVNLAYGSLIMAGAYATIFANHGLGLDPLLCLPLAMLFTFMLGYLMQAAVLNQIVRGGVATLTVCTFATEIFMVELASRLFGLGPQQLEAWYSDINISLPGGAEVPFAHVLTIAVAIPLFAVFDTIMRRSSLGKVLAVSTRTVLARADVSEIRFDRAFSLIFALGAALAGGVGTLLSLNFSLTPAVGGFYTIVAFAVIAVGGFSSITGSMAGGLVVGMALSLTELTVGAAYQAPSLFALILAALLLRQPLKSARSNLTETPYATVPRP